LVGTGRIGRIHARNLTYNVPGRGSSATDADRTLAEQCARDFNVPQVVQDIHEMLADPDMDAVAICSSTDTHAQFIIAAARAGKPIFCEKPVALDLASIDEALAEVNKTGVRLMVGFNRRFHPNFRKIRELVAAGKIGDPHLVRITSRDCAPPPVEYVKVSGGIFLDMTIHDFDMARYLVDDEVTVFTTGSAVDRDWRSAGCRYSGCRMKYTVVRFARLTTITSGYGYDQRMVVFGGGSVLTYSNKYPDKSCIMPRRGPCQSAYLTLSTFIADLCGRVAIR
jgi:myo-inositol 2-dehydrogenase/D-chiro-inositol 1-dehydrogenase